MESVGAMYEGEWSNFNGMYSNEEADFMAHLLGNCSIPNEVPTNISTTNFEFFSSWTNHDGPIYNYSSEETSAGDQMYSFSQGSSFCVPQMTGNLEFNNYIGMEAGDEFLNQDLSNDSMESSGGDLAGTAPLQLGRDHQQEDKEYETPKKRPRIPLDVKNKRIVKPKRNQEKINSTDKNDESSEDDSNELNEESKEAKSALNLKGKTRASRGSATDPQSLYARKRRERINERLRILQNLVPNGTKVDISTMLEEAVQYVKFLQIQIKLLSSNDMWMYAPIAYNGMDIGLDLKR